MAAGGPPPPQAPPTPGAPPPAPPGGHRPGGNPVGFHLNATPPPAVPNPPNGPHPSNGPGPPRPSGGTATYELAELQELERPSRWRRVILIGASVALFGAAGTTAFLIGSSSSSSEPPEAGTVGYDVALVASEETDTEALSTDHLFPDTVESVSGDSYSLLHSDDMDNCGDAGNGAFAAALDEAECRQVVRGVYIGDDVDAAVSVGVAAFPTDETAAEVTDAQDIDSGEWFTGLAGPEDTPAAEIDSAGGAASGLTWGRYHVFALATNPENPNEGADALAELSEEFLTVPFTPLGDRAVTD